MDKLEKLHKEFKALDVNDDFFVWSAARKIFKEELDERTVEWYEKYGKPAAAAFHKAAIDTQPCPLCGGTLKITEHGQRADSRNYGARTECNDCGIIALTGGMAMTSRGVSWGKSVSWTDEFSESSFKNAPKDPRKIYA